MTEPFTWRPPFLAADGQVWVYGSYGVYDLLPQDHPRAQFYFGRLADEGYRKAQTWRLEMFLTYESMEKTR